MIVSTVELFLVSFGLTYLLAMTIAGLRVLRESRRELALASARSSRSRTVRRRLAGRRLAGRRPGRQTHRRPMPPDLAPAMRRWRRLCGQLTNAEQPAPRAALVFPPEDFQLYFLVPCLNEELVIGRTVGCLLDDPRARVVVVDDGSDDRTGDLARAAGADLAGAAGADRVMVVRRELPEARRGKGPALNAGLTRILQDAAVRHIPVAQIIVCVMDADGELSPGAREAVLPLFADPQVGGVQLPVRIRNRDQGLLPLMQDVLFWGLSAVSQLGRVRSGTVSLGGNGQFTRLSALLELAREPWRSCLTEDLDLSLALTAAGWRITATADASVSQQGVTTTKALLKQWTRWYQGHMTSARWLPTLWSSRRLSHLSMLEVTLFLMVPWTLVLPWSVLFHYSLYVMIMKVSAWQNSPVLGTDGLEHLATLLLWYAMSFSPNWIVGYLYYRQDRRSGFFRAVLISHVLLAANYVAYAAAWRALFRMIVRRTSWTKTARHHELGGTALPVLAGLVPAPRTAVSAAAVAATEPVLVGAGSHRIGELLAADRQDLVAVGSYRAGELLAADREDRAGAGGLRAGGPPADRREEKAGVGRHREGSSRPASRRAGRVPAGSRVAGSHRAGGMPARRS